MATLTVDSEYALMKSHSKHLYTKHMIFFCVEGFGPLPGRIKNMQEVVRSGPLGHII